jgi:glyoxylase I family protein
MNREKTQRSSAPDRPATAAPSNPLYRFHGVRYQVKDVSRSVDFYHKQLGFELGHQQPPSFADVSIDGLTILLSGPGASGSRPMPNGQRQEPGGWNRVVLEVDDRQ